MLERPFGRVVAGSLLTGCVAQHTVAGAHSSYTVPDLDHLTGDVGAQNGRIPHPGCDDPAERPRDGIHGVHRDGADTDHDLARSSRGARGRSDLEPALG